MKHNIDNKQSSMTSEEIAKLHDAFLDETWNTHKIDILTLFNPLKIAKLFIYNLKLLHKAIKCYTNDKQGFNECTKLFLKSHSLTKMKEFSEWRLIPTDSPNWTEYAIHLTLAVICLIAEYYCATEINSLLGLGFITVVFGLSVYYFVYTHIVHEIICMSEKIYNNTYA